MFDTTSDAFILKYFISFGPSLDMFICISASSFNSCTFDPTSLSTYAASIRYLSYTHPSISITLICLSLTHYLSLIGQLVPLFFEVCRFQFALSDLFLDIVSEASELVSDNPLNLLLIKVDKRANF
jgi:hypothetical protein